MIAPHVLLQHWPKLNVTATNNFGCPAVSNQLSVDTYPQIPVDVSFNNDTLTAHNYSDYQWHYNNNPILCATSSVYVAVQPGTYYVTAIDSFGCHTMSVQKQIAKLGIVAVTEDEGVWVYPNPVGKEGWKLDVSTQWIAARCEVYDATGKLVKQFIINDTSSKIALALAPGIYLMKLRTPERNHSLRLTRR